MKAMLQLSQPASYADYLAIEGTSEHRNEFINGVIVAMAGGSYEHSAIGSKLTFLLMSRLTGQCRHHSSDQRFWIASSGRGRYADGSIICGDPEAPPHDHQAAINPSITIEVLSPSTAGDDNGDKRIDFQSLPSLRAYVLVHQDQRCVRIYRRSERGDWNVDAEVYRNGQGFELPKLTTPIAVADIYDGILDERGGSLMQSARSGQR